MNKWEEAKEAYYSDSSESPETFYLIQAAEEEIADLKEDNAKMLNDICEYIKENDKLREALIHIEEYWNQDLNMDAMADALYEITSTALEALKENSDA